MRQRRGRVLANETKSAILLVSGLPARSGDMVPVLCPNPQPRLALGDDARHAKCGSSARIPVAAVQTAVAQSSDRVRKTNGSQWRDLLGPAHSKDFELDVL
jgi:hypothetical protein